MDGFVGVRLDEPADLGELDTGGLLREATDTLRRTYSATVKEQAGGSFTVKFFPPRGRNDLKPIKCALVGVRGNVVLSLSFQHDVSTWLHSQTTTGRAIYDDVMDGLLPVAQDQVLSYVIRCNNGSFLVSYCNGDLHFATADLGELRQFIDECFVVCCGEPPLGTSLVSTGRDFVLYVMDAWMTAFEEVLLSLLHAVRTIHGYLPQ